MSYSQLVVFRDGIAECDEEYRNSHGTVTVIWDALLQKYEHLVCPDKPFMSPPTCGILGGWEKLWSVHAEGKLPLRPWEEMALQWSYDNALVHACDAHHLARALERFEDAHVVTARRVCHLSAIAKRMRELSDDEAVTAFGIHATSVCENPWFDHDSETGESAPYSTKSGTRHHFITVVS